MTLKKPNTHRRRKRKKATADDPNAAAPPPEKADCLLDLPESVLHRILCRVPTTEAMRVSVLSKRWRRVWFKLPGLFFSDSGFLSPKDFCRNVRRSMALRRNDILGTTANPIVSFRLELNRTWRWNSVEKWLKLISNAKLNELDLHFQPRHTKYYRLPPSLLQNATTLTQIRLFGFDAKGLDSASLRNLSSLSLKLVALNDQDLKNLLTNCVALEKLRVHTCTGLKEPRISSPRLKCLEIGHSVDGERFAIDAPNLESFVCDSLVADSSLSLSASLRNLVFVASGFDDLWLEDLICSLPLLESLTLLGCNGLKHVNIRGPNLTHFTFHGNGDGCKASAKVDSLSLVYFCFRGKLQPGFTMNPINLSEANVRLYKSQIDVDELHPVLLKFLTSLNCSNSLAIDLHSEKVLSFPQELRVKSESPLPKLKHMKIRTKVSPSNDPEFKKVLDWVSPSLETLSVTKRY